MTPLALNTDGVTHIVVAGDWHGTDGWARLVIQAAAREGIHTIVHVGDFGIGPWSDAGRSMTRLVDAALYKYGSQLFVVPGNHENFDRLYSVRKDEGGMLVLGKRLRAVPFGHRWEIGDAKFGAIGGAVSVDRQHRIPGKSWWPQEVPTQDDVNRLGDAPLDVLVTHDVPMGEVPLRACMRLPGHLEAECNDVRRLLTRAVQMTRPRVNFCGHWHQRVTGGVRHRSGWTRVEVLENEWLPGNAVILDLATFEVTPLRASL